MQQYANPVRVNAGMEYPQRLLLIAGGHGL